MATTLPITFQATLNVSSEDKLQEVLDRLGEARLLLQSLGVKVGPLKMAPLTKEPKDGLFQLLGVE